MGQRRMHQLFDRDFSKAWKFAKRNGIFLFPIENPNREGGNVFNAYGCSLFILYSGVYKIVHTFHGVNYIFYSCITRLEARVYV